MRELGIRSRNGERPRRRGRARASDRRQRRARADDADLRAEAPGQDAGIAALCLGGGNGVALADRSSCSRLRIELVQTSRHGRRPVLPEGAPQIRTSADFDADIDSRRRRRRHHGQRHRPGVRADRVRRPAGRRRARGAGPRARHDREEPRQVRREGQADAPTDRDAALARLAAEPTLDELADVDYVVEAIVENVDVKRDVFARLDPITRPDVILSSNTSSISITTLGAATKRPDKVLGMHFMNPVPLMTLVELIRGQATSPGDRCRRDRAVHARWARRRSKPPTIPASSPTAS